MPRLPPVRPPTARQRVQHAVLPAAHQVQPQPFARHPPQGALQGLRDPRPVANQRSRCLLFAVGRLLGGAAGHLLPSRLPSANPLVSITQRAATGAHSVEPNASSTVPTAPRRSEVKTTDKPQPRLRRQRSRTNSLPVADARPCLQSVANPPSLSSVIEWASRTTTLLMAASLEFRTSVGASRGCLV